ncbi:MAG: hypothetical protein EPN86_03625 [Nanoarchaeota archaeon]|nr:MAG: hypothetical protein EPN86_03625 [Nanoarchaeota archaeon]
MSETEQNKEVIRAQIDQLIARDESGQERPDEERLLLRSFVVMILEVLRLANAYRSGISYKQRRPIEHEEVSKKQKELRVLSLRINGANTKNKIVELMKQLHPELADIELEIV